jgi:hypothetical protein
MVLVNQGMASKSKGVVDAVFDIKTTLKVRSSNVVLLVIVRGIGIKE